jgi:micrococcal nuclease
MEHRRYDLWLVIGLLALAALALLWGPLRERLSGAGTARGELAGEVVDVVDGDTIQVGPMLVRLIGINAPELGQPNDMAARQRLQQLVGGETVRLEYDMQHTDEFGRTLAYVYAPDGAFANLEMVRSGLAHVYTQPPNVAHTNELNAAEREARAASRGIWAPSDAPLRIQEMTADAKGPDEGNLNGEWVAIENYGPSTVDLEHFTLADAGNHTFEFPATSLAPGQKLRLHTGAGDQTPGDLHWSRTGPVWNNGGDAAFLRDPQGRLVDVYSYGLR